MDYTDDQPVTALQSFLSYLQSAPTESGFQALRESFSRLGEVVYDVVWLAGLRDSSSDYVQAYAAAVTALCDCGVLKRDLCLEQLDEEVLAAAKLVESADALEKKVRRARTKFLYEQQKFNLLREESNGYAKLLCVLSSKSQEVHVHISELVSAYDLDPNRVLDLMLDSLEVRKDCWKLMEFARGFSSTVVTQLVGFKFLNAEKHSTGLAVTAGWALKTGIMSMESLWPFLTPLEDEYIFSSFDSRLREARAIAKSLASARISNNIGDRRRDEAVIEELQRQPNDNQKLWVMEGLVRVNCWGEAKSYLGYFGKKLEITRHPHLAAALCDLLTWAIDPYYRSLSPRELFCSPSVSLPAIPAGDVTQAASFSSTLAVISDVLEILDIAVSFDAVLFAKICRIFREAPSDDRVFRLMKTCLVPSLTVSRGSPGVMAALWSLLSLYPVRQRQEVYALWGDCASYPLTVLEEAITIRNLHSLLKRLSRDSVRSERRAVLKLIHICPVASVQVMVVQLMNYESLVPVFVTALSYCPEVVLDIVPYIVVKVITGRNRDKVDMKTGVIAAWFQNLILFLGSFYGDRHRVSLDGVLVAIRSGLMCGDVLMFLLLPQIIAKMSGWAEPDELTDRQLEASAGGIRLRSESFDLTNEIRHMTHGAYDLWLALSSPADQHQSVAVELLVLANAQAKAVLMRLETPHVKLLGLFHDQLQNVFVRLSEFLQLQARTQSQYLALLPTSALQSLLTAGGMTVARAMHICRPGYQLEDLRSVEKQLQGYNATVPLPLFALFWILSPQDLMDTSALYEAAIQAMKVELDSRKPSRELSRLSVTKAELEQESEVLTSRRNLATVLFRSLLPLSQLNSSEFVQHCLFPRMLLTPADARFCSRFVEVMQKQRFTWFATVEIVRELVAALVPCVYCTTEKESETIGYFLKSLFAVMKEWKEESRFAAECASTPGFAQCDFSSFCELVSTCHCQLTQTLTKCFESRDSVSQRNALILLWKLTPDFPSSAQLAEQLVTSVRKIAAGGASDLKVIAQRYADRVTRMKAEKWTEKSLSSRSAAHMFSPSPGLADRSSAESRKRLREERFSCARERSDNSSDVFRTTKKRSRLS